MRGIEPRYRGSYHLGDPLSSEPRLPQVYVWEFLDSTSVFPGLRSLLEADKGVPNVIRSYFKSVRGQ